MSDWTGVLLGSPPLYRVYTFTYANHFFLSCLCLAQNSLTTQYTHKSSKSSLLTMASSTPARTKHPNTCHNTSVPEAPCTPIVPPSSAPLRTGSERVVGASATVQEEQSNYSAFTMASSTPMPPTNITHVRVRLTSEDEYSTNADCPLHVKTQDSSQDYLCTSISKRWGVIRGGRLSARGTKQQEHACIFECAMRATTTENLTRCSRRFQMQ